MGLFSFFTKRPVKEVLPDIPIIPTTVRNYPVSDESCANTILAFSWECRDIARDRKELTAFRTYAPTFNIEWFLEQCRALHSLPGIAESGSYVEIAQPLESPDAVGTLNALWGCVEELRTHWRDLPGVEISSALRRLYAEVPSLWPDCLDWAEKGEIYLLNMPDGIFQERIVDEEWRLPTPDEPAVR